MIPEHPYGGMAERTLVRRGAWLPVPDGVDDVTAAAYANPGMAAWTTIVWEGEVAAGQTVLVLGATGASGRIAAQLAVRQGARVVAAGRRQRVLDELAETGAEATIRVDRPRDELAAAIAAAGPYDLIADYLWGPPAEVASAALAQRDSGPRRTRYIVVGMAAGEAAAVPAMTLRIAQVYLFGSGTGRAASPADAAAAYADLVRQAAAGELGLEVETVPLAAVERAWGRARNDPRIVFVP